LKQRFGIDGIYTAICADLGIQPDQDRNTFLKNQCEDSAFDQSGLLTAARAMIDHGSAKTDQPNGQIIANWLEKSPEERQHDFFTYAKAFLTQKNEQRSKLATKAVADASPDVLDVLAAEAHRIIAILNTLNAIENATLTRDILTLGHHHPRSLHHFEISAERTRF